MLGQGTLWPFPHAPGCSWLVGWALLTAWGKGQLRSKEASEAGNWPYREAGGVLFYFIFFIFIVERITYVPFPPH